MSTIVLIRTTSPTALAVLRPWSLLWGNEHERVAMSHNWEACEAAARAALLPGETIETHRMDSWADARVAAQVRS